MTYRDYISIEKHALTLFTSAFLSPYDELFNIKQNFKMKKYMPLNGLRWSRDSGSALCGTPPTDVLGQAGGGGKRTVPFQRSRKTDGLYIHFCFARHLQSISSARAAQASASAKA